MIKIILALSCSFVLLEAQCEKRLFNIALNEEASIEEMLERLALTCSFSIIIKDELARSSLNQTHKNIFIKELTLNEIFDLLLKENNLFYTYDNKALKISALNTQIFKINYITSVREGQSIVKASVDSKIKKENEFSDSVNEDNLIKSSEKFNFWQDIEKELFRLLNNGTDLYEAKAPIINANAGLITVSGTYNQLLRVQNYISNLEQRLKQQVIIDVSIISVTLNKEHSSGINWQSFDLSFNTQNSTGANSFVSFQSDNSASAFVRNLGFRAGFDLSSLLAFLSQSGQTKVLSNPKLMALNNQQAIISVGDTINYQVKESSISADSGTTLSESFNNYSIFIGILLSILPEISDDGKIMLRINPSLSDFKYPQDNRRQNTPRIIAPDTVQKKLSTVVQVENNQTLILGGLINTNKVNDENSVNFLSKIPLLGALFKGQSTIENSSEIVFVITPMIVSNSQTLPTLKELGFKAYE